jgi:hypothetical protein
MLRPHWAQPRVGPLLRGGIDYRCYKNQILLLGLFQARAHEIGGWKRRWIEKAATSTTESEKLNLSDFSHSRDVLIEFEGDRGQFEVLRGWDQFLLHEIRAMTKERWLAVAERKGAVPIGINVRLGRDFKKARTSADYFIKGATRTPLSWFIKSLRITREALGYCARAYVLSDGTAKQLGQLLSEENVLFVRPGCAISDLLILSRAEVLLASGGSSFSAWASFLGQMPTISHPGQSMTWFKLENSRGNYVGELDPDSPPQSFLDNVMSLRRSRLLPFQRSESPQL